MSIFNQPGQQGQQIQPGQQGQQDCEILWFIFIIKTINYIIDKNYNLVLVKLNKNIVNE
jgi:hypothetical protein